MGAAGPGGGQEGDELITEINVTPMVDIMLVLLIIFMVTASFIVSPSMKVELPRGSAKAAAGKQHDLVIVVTRDGTIQHGGKVLSPTALLDFLRGEHKKRPDARVLIVADTKAYHGNVVKIMDLARSVGFPRLGVAIDNRP